MFINSPFSPQKTNIKLMTLQLVLETYLGCLSNQNLTNSRKITFSKIVCVINKLLLPYNYNKCHNNEIKCNYVRFKSGMNILKLRSGNGD